MNATINDTISNFEIQKDHLARAVVELQHQRKPEFWERYGSKGWDFALRDQLYHFDYLHESLRTNDKAVFTNYVEWLKGLFENLSFPADTLEETLICTREVLSKQLTPDLWSAYEPVIKAGLAVARESRTAIPTYIPEDAPMADLARGYLGALLKGERHAASRMVLDAAEKGESIKAIYLNVFQRSQLEVGRLWYQNKVSVAQEHYCSAATQMIMSQLYPYVFATPKIGRRMVAACVGGELHEIGIRMVADFFELEGWDTYYLGANTPKTGLLQILDEKQPDLLALSATLPLHRSALADLVGAVRERSQGIKIMIGGYTINANTSLWKQLGADGHAADAHSALDLGRRLIDTQGDS